MLASHKFQGLLGNHGAPGMLVGENHPLSRDQSSSSGKPPAKKRSSSSKSSSQPPAKRGRERSFEVLKGPRFPLRHRWKAY